MIRKFTRAAVALLAAIFLAPVAVFAAPTQPNAWVSGKGTDAAGCGTATNPCRSFQYAHDNVVAAGGQIRAQDAAGFKPLVITKSISVIGDDAGLAGVSAPGGDGIVVNASPTDTVFIKGVTLDGQGTGVSGIKALAVGNLTIAKNRRVCWRRPDRRTAAGRLRRRSQRQQQRQ